MTYLIWMKICRCWLLADPLCLTSFLPSTPSFLFFYLCFSSQFSLRLFCIFFFLLVFSLSLFFCFHVLSSVFSPLQYFFFSSGSPYLFSCSLPLRFVPSSAFYRLPCYLSPQDHDKAWGHCVSVGLGHQQSRPCCTPFYKHEGVRNSSLSLQDCNLHEDKICNLSCGWTGMPVVHNFLSFFAGGL